ncbi:probable G-protein coupled receptor 160 isoform X2 [Rattus norvegicus]|uniref:probable G-protein coupled receptor 160 isoform X2 n=1 Tax=Rattus norvegicus TaxID=10116 RepID=UPI002FD807EB
MTALPSKNCSFQYQSHQAPRSLDATCLLLLIILGKVLLNVLILRVKRKDTSWSFMEYFCFSLALVDLLLLIVSFAYGFLHYPVCSLACIDYWCNLSRATKPSSRWQKLLYLLTVILTWISVLAYVLGDPAISASLKTHKTSVNQCPSYVSTQSHWLSLSMLMILSVAFLISWQEVVALIQAIRIASYKNKAVLYFPFPPHTSYTVSPRAVLLPRLIVCFLGTWFPFVALQVLILSLRVQIPAYIEMNVPWLYFVNSFLIAAVYWFNCHKLYWRDGMFPVDPFINWKCCFVPVHRLKQVERPMSIIIC